MENKVKSFTPAEALKPHHRKENSFYKQLSLIDLRDGSDLVTLRFYGPGSTAYACAWVHIKGAYAHGSDSAGGGGYHKESAAAYGALRNAGFVFDKHFSGAGDAAITEALGAIARHCGLRKKYTIVKAHS